MQESSVYSINVFIGYPQDKERERAYVCRVLGCGKSSKRNRSLKQDTVFHEGIETIRQVCRVCELNFLYPIILQSHGQTETGDKSLVCNV
jgi:hypothetical protein